ncbi:MAG: hypothetical protein EOP38_02170 [Rubrivivax sp.]|nr:MAG: hypothetical protein EOP38_02170 [Rubrivivax sp.]
MRCFKQTLVMTAVAVLATATVPWGAVEAAPPCPAQRINWGVNFHLPPEQWDKIPDVIAPRGITRIRVGVWGNDAAYIKRLRTLVTNLGSRNVKAEAIIFNAYARDYPKSKQCNADLVEVEKESYNDAKQAVSQVQDLIQDFEMLNEAPLYPNIQVPGSNGRDADDFDTPCGRMQAANLRGMSRAISDERKRTGRPLRIILGTVGRDFGFYKFMLDQGVTFDVAGYHIYPREKHKTLDIDPWFGPGGPLRQLAQFNRPVIINEFNCGETYEPDFENQPDKPRTESCYRSFANHMKVLVHQNAVNIESIYLYELVDEPQRKAPENRFGLMRDLNTPKVTMLLATAFAGGSLSKAEATEITRRGLLSQAQIDNWASCRKR